MPNPFNGLRVPMRKGKRPEEGRTVWAVEDCRRLAELGQWLPLLGLYTGARINELAQLRIADISDRIRITDEGPGQRLKNSASRREVPIHLELKKRGFLEFVDARRRAGQERLFDFALGRDGYGQAASRWFNRYRVEHCFKQDFHSLRHTVATRLRNAGVPGRPSCRASWSLQRADDVVQSICEGVNVASSGQGPGHTLLLTLT